ncbi:D-glycero-beta-D-manno-heptose 1,7-bisphosphate 7-phosphatase [Helicobacter sp. 13S00477-4]|uniref:D-glycero-beta-D-manno-heptose 1,7-bisphosphate 7-phosphatase n=1 Tax=Helicobacter sp. 13S00477-4 TaxID=1905759 RepID=UPI000BA70C9A|nr:D-glycero-beta-D-manno-heptose 1,7-bisphosphate 7-phosphatase [Helicobacter sp. 13S00477-4]PAF52647.1 D,D-heptose 1,7-bisphosphate phosphatase [Helicobacter sp. 13S00477-4]
MKAIFFDRDGVINKDFGYVYEAKDFIFMDDIFDFLKLCKEKDFLLLLATNQSGIGRGYYTIDDFKELTLYMQNQLKKRLGFAFESVYFCPHDPNEDCLCRKPKPGMLQKAKIDYKLDFQKCFIIGDKITDMQAGQNAGIKNKIFLTTGNENTTSIDNIHEVSSIKEALQVMNRLITGD